VVARVAALLAVTLQGCYYLSQYRGQLAILSASKSVDEVVASGKLRAEDADTCRFIQEVKKFAEGHVGLKKTENFTTYYDAGTRPVSWSVSACRKDRFDPYLWLYPIVGPSRYKGFFEKEDALREQARVAKLGYDTHVSPVTAYSTLGWFKDPIYSHFLRYSKADLADLIIHELVHSTIYVAGDTAYNESLASFVASVAGETFVREKFGAASAELKEFRGELADQDRSEGFIDGIFGLLDGIYRSGRAERRDEAFELIRAEYAAAKGQWNRPRHGAFEGKGVNNAIIMGSRTYFRTDWWRAVFEHCGRDWKSFLKLAERAGEGRDPFREMEKNVPGLAGLTAR